MSVTKAQADRTRRDAQHDLREDGARVVIMHEGEARVDPITGEAPPVVDRMVRTFALLTSYTLALVDGQAVQLGDLRAMVADADLEPLGDALGEGVAPDGWWVYIGQNPTAWPSITPLAGGTRRLRIVAVEQVVYEGGWPVLRFLRLRG